MPLLSDFDAFFQSKKNANCILELEKSLLSDDNDCVLSSLDVFKDVITKVFQKGMLQASSNSDAAEEKFRLWLMNCYNDFVSHLVGYLVHENSTIQEKSLDTLMVLVSLEGDNTKEGWFFPKDLFHKIVCALASQDVEQKSLIDNFQKYTVHDDIKTYLLMAVLKLLQEKKEVTDVLLWNVYHLLDTFEYPKQFDAASNTFLSREGFQLQKKLFCKLFSNVWTQFLKFTLPPALLHNVLFDIHEKVLPHVSNPCLMTDFLTDAYKHGGDLSLLSLNGLYYLIDKHNVEYPDFFKKLYSLFDTLAEDKHSPMLFSMADHFLSSTHLPAYLLAAFVKKPLRFVLYTTTDITLRILPFVFNILIRNPVLEELIHRPTITPGCPLGADCKGPGVGYYRRDPFDLYAEDPAESKALESSLWEIRTMLRHSFPEIVSKAKFILHELATKEFDLTPALNTTMSKIYKEERKRKAIEAPPAAAKPSKLKKWYRL